MDWECLNSFRLVGGTALSLQLGHRKSIDIDLFTADYPLTPAIQQKFREQYPTSEIRSTSFSITIFVPDSDNGELKIDLMSNEAYIRPIVSVGNIRMAHIEDIAAMKLEAITSRTEKKDYWDIAELLRVYSFGQLISFYKERYPWNDIRDVVEKASMAHNCDQQPDPVFLGSEVWEKKKLSIREKIDLFIGNEIN